MPKNIIPKDNIPKIFEVREVENQIPTYEEFLKNYQTDQKVNESYENEIASYSDIDSNKNYGPMWGDSQYGERWTNLQIPCPVRGCSNSTITNQTHTCGGQVEISNRARVKCRSCGTASHVVNWKFNCASHSGSYRTVSSDTDLNSFRDALMIALRSGCMDGDIVMELIRNLRNNP